MKKQLYLATLLSLLCSGISHTISERPEPPARPNYTLPQQVGIYSIETTPMAGQSGLDAKKINFELHNKGNRTIRVTILNGVNNIPNIIVGPNAFMRTGPLNYKNSDTTIIIEPQLGGAESSEKPFLPQQYLVRAGTASMIAVKYNEHSSARLEPQQGRLKGFGFYSISGLPLKGNVSAKNLK
ncbi:hypothetical protein Noda2021_12330 [Candidatus Dependentiae bacterium Noda2021]|nr:hypothetical protein Noda2021_12330 [Candidatus Dependentiae bacterium Noda2021]